MSECYQVTSRILMGRLQSPPERGSVQHVCCSYGNQNTLLSLQNLPFPQVVLSLDARMPYRGEDESEQAIIFGQETSPKFTHKRNTELTITLVSK